jgi:hypothetical protein
VTPDPLDFIRPALRWERRKKGDLRILVPNVVDTGSAASIAIASTLYRSLGVPEVEATGALDAGRLLERGIAEYLRTALPALDPRPWQVDTPGKEMTLSGQYSHFQAVRKLVGEDPALRAAIGTDYLIAPDITIQLPRRFASSGAPGQHPAPGAPLLHASVSCKWTLRSDRAQNVRPEAGALIRHRCGRVPHIVVVTAEPTVGRISSIAKGTGDLDAVFHVCLPELEDAMRENGFDSQADQLGDLGRQGRLFDLRYLPAILAEW